MANPPSSYGYHKALIETNEIFTGRVLGRKMRRNRWRGRRKQNESRSCLFYEVEVAAG